MDPIPRHALRLACSRIGIGGEDIIWDQPNATGIPCFAFLTDNGPADLAEFAVNLGMIAHDGGAGEEIVFSYWDAVGIARHAVAFPEGRPAGFYFPGVPVNEY